LSVTSIFFGKFVFSLVHYHAALPLILT